MYLIRLTLLCLLISPIIASAQTNNNPQKRRSIQDARMEAIKKVQMARGGNVQEMPTTNVSVETEDITISNFEEEQTNINAPLINEEVSKPELLEAEIVIAEPVEDETPFTGVFHGASVSTMSSTATW